MLTAVRAASRRSGSSRTSKCWYGRRITGTAAVGAGSGTPRKR